MSRKKQDNSMVVTEMPSRIIAIELELQKIYAEIAETRALSEKQRDEVVLAHTELARKHATVMVELEAARGNAKNAVDYLKQNIVEMDSIGKSMKFRLSSVMETQKLLGDRIAAVEQRMSSAEQTAGKFEEYQKFKDFWESRK